MYFFKFFNPIPCAIALGTRFQNFLLTLKILTRAQNFGISSISKSIATFRLNFPAAIYHSIHNITQTMQFRYLLRRRKIHNDTLTSCMLIRILLSRQTPVKAINKVSTSILHNTNIARKSIRTSTRCFSFTQCRQKRGSL